MLKQGIFQVFAIICVTKLKAFFGKVKQRLLNYLNQNLVIGNLLGNGLEATLSSNTNVLRDGKGHF